MQITPIPEKEAAEQLGMSLRTIRNAVERGDLIRIPVTGQIQHVASEQVELFKGKTRLVRGVLSPNQMQQWQLIYEEITQSKDHLTIAPTNVALNVDAEQLVKALIKNGVVGTGNQLTFQSALADENTNDSNQELLTKGREALQKELKRPSILFAILLGLVLLFFAFSKEKSTAFTQAQAALKDMGLETEDLKSNRGKVIEALKSHPQETERLTRILRKEDLLSVA